jgi:uncharacterized membrane protein
MSGSVETGERGPGGVLPGDRDAAAMLTAGVVSGLTLAVAFGLLALGVESFWVTFVVGFGFVLPTSIGVVASRWPEAESPADAPTGSTDSDDRPAMEALRLQYARGEIDDAEFDRRARRLAETEE